MCNKYKNINSETEYESKYRPEAEYESESEYDSENEYVSEAEYELAIKNYIVQCLIMEGSKIIIFFVIFAAFKLIPQYLTGLFVLMLVRCNGGGLHCQHYISCFLLSLLVLTAGILCGIYIPVNKIISIIILISCCIIGYCTVPIVSKNRPEPGIELIKQSKQRTAKIILLFLFLICICPYNQFLNICTWTIIIHIFQLLLANFMQRRNGYVSS